MTENTCNYWLIQFQPSPRRDERVNLGIVVSSFDGRLAVRAARAVAPRIRHLDDRPEAVSIARVQLRTVVAWVNATATAARADNIDELAGRLCNEVRLGARQQVRGTDADQLADDLFATLVESGRRHRCIGGTRAQVVAAKALHC